MASCSKSKKQESLKEQEENFIRPAEMTLDKNDTATVNELVNQYLNRLQNKKFQDAMNMLYFLKNDSVVPVPEKFKKRQMFTMQAFQGVRYELQSITFLRETDCEVKYKSILFEKKAGDNRPNDIVFALRPVRIQGKWYLTVDDTDNKDAAPTQIPQ